MEFEREGKAKDYGQTMRIRSLCHKREQDADLLHPKAASTPRSLLKLFLIHRLKHLFTRYWFNQLLTLTTSLVSCLFASGLPVDRPRAAALHHTNRS